MNNIEIKINKNTKMVDLSKTIIGNEGESKQGNLIFTFDEFVDGQARLEFEIDGVLDIVYPQKVGESYQLPILSKLTKKGQINMQLVITSGTSEDEVAIFKSNVFYIYCNYSINAESEQPEEYPSWIEIANTKLNQFENVIQIIETEGTGKRFLSDDGTYKEVGGATGGGAIDDVRVDGLSVVKDRIAYINLSDLEKTLQDILTIIRGGELDENQVVQIEELIVSYFETKTIKEVEE